MEYSTINILPTEQPLTLEKLNEMDEEMEAKNYSPTSLLGFVKVLLTRRVDSLNLARMFQRMGTILGYI